MAEEMKAVNQRVKLAGLRAHPRNYNVHPAGQVEKLATSLRKFGQVRSIVTWRSTILAGHGVVEAARLLGWQEVSADVLPDEYPEHLALAYVAAALERWATHTGKTPVLVEGAPAGAHGEVASIE